MNEDGVCMTATDTLNSATSAIKALDPTVSTSKGGLAEVDMTSVVLMQATSARDAVELMAHIIDTVGSAEYNGIIVSDPNEAWMFDTLSGHQYIAVKMPSSEIGFTPNITMDLDSVDVTDTNNVIASPGLISVPQAAGTLKLDANGHILIADSYVSKPTSVSARMYLGYYYLEGVDAARALVAGYYPFFTSPGEVRSTHCTKQCGSWPFTAIRPIRFTANMSAIRPNSMLLAMPAR